MDNVVAVVSILHKNCTAGCRVGHGRRLEGMMLIQRMIRCPSPPTGQRRGPGYWRMDRATGLRALWDTSMGRAFMGRWFPVARGDEASAGGS